MGKVNGLLNDSQKDGSPHNYRPLHYTDIYISILAQRARVYVINKSILQTGSKCTGMRLAGSSESGTVDWDIS